MAHEIGGHRTTPASSDSTGNILPAARAPTVGSAMLYNVPCYHNYSPLSCYQVSSGRLYLYQPAFFPEAIINVISLLVVWILLKYVSVIVMSLTSHILTSFWPRLRNWHFCVLNFPFSAVSCYLTIVISTLRAPWILCDHCNLPQNSNSIQLTNEGQWGSAAN